MRYSSSKRDFTLFRREATCIPFWVSIYVVAGCGASTLYFFRSPKSVSFCAPFFTLS
ncbi:MAG: hypothetical protein IKP20_02105 [Candidatus Methanomethylophilaceae archaeon]|nr:hypothetical protein [Candidatus Methanomethylophilaceae archaeon]